MDESAMQVVDFDQPDTLAPFTPETTTVRTGPGGHEYRVTARRSANPNAPT
jgi:hypothetical protein